MSRQSETAYPTLKANISPGELERSFTPTSDELMFVQGLVRGPAPQTAMMVQLKMLQRMGRMIKASDVPAVIRDHIARCLTFPRSPTGRELDRFERSGSRVIRELRDEGFPISEELLAETNPYRIGHVNMLGDYAIDRRRRVVDLVEEPILSPAAKAP